MTRLTQETTLTKHMKNTQQTKHIMKNAHNSAHLKNDQYKKRKHETHTKRFFGNANKTMTRNILKKHVKRNNTIKTNHNDATLY